jgi:hypothetical protein
MYVSNILCSDVSAVADVLVFCDVPSVVDILANVPACEMVDGIGMLHIHSHISRSGVANTDSFKTDPEPDPPGSESLV